MKKAFTLAEVLITLGIIGVVSAITIPTLISKYRAQVLKTQFKKSYSNMSQVVQRVGIESGLILGQYCTQHNGSNYFTSGECISLINSYFKRVGKCSYSSKVLNYSKTANAYIDAGPTATPLYKLADGTCMIWGVNASMIGVTVDINGDKKGPNALGHDIFAFYVQGENNNLVPFKMSHAYTEEELEAKRKSLGIVDYENDSSLWMNAGYSQLGRPCSKNDTRRGNGGGCSWYALNDESPDYPSKGYWESLPR